MTPQELIYRALGKPDVTAGASSGHCCLCGAPNGSLDRKPFVKDGFTNLDRLAAPDSPAICPPCAYIFVNPKLRQSSWIMTEERAIWLKREDIWHYLFDECPAPPTVWYVTTSYKKHGSFKSRVNYSKACTYIQYEETGVSFRHDYWRPVADAVQLLYSVPKEDEGKANPRTFFTKDEILHDTFSQPHIRAFGVDEFMALSGLLRQYRPQPGFGLVVYAANRTNLGRRIVDWKKKTETQHGQTQETLF